MQKYLMSVDNKSFSQLLVIVDVVSYPSDFFKRKMETNKSILIANISMFSRSQRNVLGITKIINLHQSSFLPSVISGSSLLKQSLRVEDQTASSVFDNLTKIVITQTKLHFYDPVENTTTCRNMLDGYK